MEIALAQLKPVSGDLERNAHSIVRAVEDAGRAGAVLVVTPARALTGLVSADRAADPRFAADLDRVLADLAARLRGPVVALGAADHHSGRIVDCVRLLRDGVVTPSHQQRHASPRVLEIGATRFAFAIADDAIADALADARSAGAHALFALAASPYRVGIHERRQALLGAAAAHANLPVYLVNAIGADGTAVFDGASFVTDATGTLVQQVPPWHATVAIARMSAGSPIPVRGRLDKESEAHVYEALVLAVREAAARFDARTVTIEATDSLDRALALAIARDALGGENVALADGPSGTPASDATRTRDHVAAEGGGKRRVASRTLRLHACNRSTFVLGAAGAKHATPSSRWNLLADLDRTLERSVARYRNAIGCAILEAVIDQASIASGMSAPPASALAEHADPIIAAAVEAGAQRDDLVARGYPPAVVDATLRAVRESGALQSMARITSRPADPVLGGAARSPSSGATAPALV